MRAPQPPGNLHTQSQGQLQVQGRRGVRERLHGQDKVSSQEQEQEQGQEVGLSRSRTGQIHPPPWPRKEAGTGIQNQK